MNNKFIIYCVLITTIGCSNSANKPLVHSKFQIPVVLNSNVSDTINKVLFNKEFMSGVGPLVVGKFNFYDTVDISHRNQANEFYQERKMHDHSWRDSLNLDINGFEIVPDYTQTIYYIPLTDSSSLGMYPVFVVNSTPYRKVFLGEDGNGFGIQEALNMENYYTWRAIECRGAEYFSGDSWSVIVNPNEFLVLLFPKYDGAYETDLRVRIKNDASLYVSKGFKGRINYGQFFLHPQSDLIINETTINSLLYGASFSPKDSKEFQ